MPLLKKNTLVRAQSDEFLRDDEEVFHCVMTGEIFKDYDEFAERTMLCNSMVWTCSMTGKSNLTYEEALESEQAARQMLAEFPEELRVPTLYLASLANYSSFTELADEVFSFIKDHYFIGEIVEACFSGNKSKEYHVLQVIPPTDAEIAESMKNIKNGDKQFQVLSSLYKYDLEQVKKDDKCAEKMIVGASQIKARKKSYYTKDKSNLFLKQYLEKDSNGILVVKSTALKSFGAENAKFTDFFAGPEPVFIPKKVGKPAKKVRQETLTKFLSKNNIIMNPEDEEKKKKQKEEEKERKQQERELQRQKNLEITMKLKDWNNVREDLLLEDQKVLPEGKPIVSNIPDQYLGDAVALLEFSHMFSPIFKWKSFLSNLSLNTMERVLLDNKAGGPLNDFIQLLLRTHFDLEVKERKHYAKASQSKVLMTADTLRSDRCQIWCAKNLGRRHYQLPVNTLTTSEILRLHLLASGENVSEAGNKWRSQYRGSYGNDEDPAIHLRKTNPHILRALSFYHVCQLSVGDKVKILNCLMNQLLSFKEFRDFIDVSIEDTKNIRNEIRAAQANERKRQADSDANISTVKKGNVGVTTDVTLRKLSAMREAEKKLRENHDAHIADLQAKLYNKTNFLGYDRAFRAYLKLNSVPAFLVSQEDHNAGACLPSPTPHVPELVDGERDAIIKYLNRQSEELNTSDKENEPSEKTSKETTNGCSKMTPDELLMCSSDPSTCVVHSARCSWRYFDKVDNIDELLDCLNKRGIRENDLRNMIDLDYYSVTTVVNKTPKYLATGVTDAKKFVREENLGYDEDMNVTDTLRMAVIESILELEEKLFDGYLGGIKNDRDVFRKLVEENKFECIDDIMRPRVQMIADEDASDMDHGQRREWYNPAGYLEELKTDIESEDSELESDEVLLSVPDEEARNVKFLAQALIQIGFSIKPIFLLKPLGSAASNPGMPPSSYKNMFYSWETSLLNVTGYNQILLHYTILDDCVMWSKSSVNMRCKVCNRGRDQDNILLCDYCNDGYHIYCLKPKLTSIPQGEWFCCNCVDIQEKIKAKKAEEMKMDMDEGLDEEDVEEIQEVQKCKVCGKAEDDDSILCCNCNHIYHFECANLKRSVRGEWTCPECREIERETREINRDIGHNPYRRCRSNDAPLNNAALQELLREVMKHPDSWPFVRPVHKHEVPDYYDIITKPMDFGKIKYKLNMGDYQYNDEVLSDCRLVFENCITYNNTNDAVYKCGGRVLKFFRNKCKYLKLDCHFDFEMHLSEESDNESSGTDRSKEDSEEPSRKRRRNK